MKSLATNFILILSLCAFSLGSLTLASSCAKDDDDGGGGGGDSPSEICDIDKCKTNAALKEACIEKVTRCFDVDQGDHDECVLIAIDACGL